MEELKKLEEIKESFTVRFPHPKLENDEVLYLGKKEYLILRSCISYTRPISVPLLVERNVIYAYRYYYGGNMYDIRVPLRKYLLTLEPKPNIPKVKRKYASGIYISEHGNLYISCLERCLVGGNEIKSYEIKSVGQAFYVFGCMEREEPIDNNLVRSLESEGKHIDDVIKELKNKSNGQVQQSSTVNSVMGCNNVQQSSTVNTIIGNGHQQSSIASTVAEGVNRLLSIELHLRTYLPLIYEAIKSVDSKLSGGVDIKGVDLSNFVDILKDFMIESSSNRLPPSSFDNRIALNEDAEKFLLMLFDRLNHLIHVEGMKKAPAYRKVKEEMDIEGSEFNKLKLEFIKSRGRGSDVTIYNIEEYYTKRFLIIEGVDSKGNKTRRVVKNLEADKKR